MASYQVGISLVIYTRPLNGNGGVTININRKITALKISESSLFNQSSTGFVSFATNPKNAEITRRHIKRGDVIVLKYSINKSNINNYGYERNLMFFISKKSYDVNVVTLEFEDINWMLKQTYLKINYAASNVLYFNKLMDNFETDTNNFLNLRLNFLAKTKVLFKVYRDKGTTESASFNTLDFRNFFTLTDVLEGLKQLGGVDSMIVQKYIPGDNPTFEFTLFCGYLVPLKVREYFTKNNITYRKKITRKGSLLPESGNLELIEQNEIIGGVVIEVVRKVRDANSGDIAPVANKTVWYYLNGVLTSNKAFYDANGALTFGNRQGLAGTTESIKLIQGSKTKDNPSGSITEEVQKKIAESRLQRSIYTGVRGSIECIAIPMILPYYYVDYEDVFVNNYTGTYNVRNLELAFDLNRGLTQKIELDKRIKF